MEYSSSLLCMCGAVIVPTWNGCSTMDTTPPVSRLYSLKAAPKPGMWTCSPAPGGTTVSGGTLGTSITPPLLLPQGGQRLIHLSLSRLNHWLPRGQTHPEVVQGTAQFHHELADALLPQADPVFHNATTLDAAVDMLDPQPPLVEHLVDQVLLQGQLLTTWLLRRH